MEEWQVLLQQTGFSGVDIELPDYAEKACQEQSIFISTALEESKTEDRGEHLTNEQARKILIVVLEGSRVQHQLSQELGNQLTLSDPSSYYSTVELGRIGDMKLENAFCIILVESENSVLSCCTDAIWSSIQRILTSSRGILWITGAGGYLHDPRLNLIDGLSRSARSENNNLVFVTLGLDNIASNISSSASKIFQVLEYTVSSGEDDFESEFVERDGLLQIPRLVEAAYLDDEVKQRTTTREAKPEKFGTGPPLELSIGSPGLLDSLHFVEDTTCTIPLRPGEIEVKVEATGVNFRDCLTALGQIDTKIIGGECAGVVTRVTDGCEFRVGERVLGAFMNTYRTYARGSSKFVAKVPKDLTFAEASALPVIFMTAWHALKDLADLQPGESVLIHAGAGGTGQAAIQIAQLLGGDVYATVGSKEKKNLLVQTYKIPEDHILYSRNATFAQGIKNLTQNHGVDVVLNSLSGDLLKASWDCVAPVSPNCTKRTDSSANIYRSSVDSLKLASRIYFHTATCRWPLSASQRHFALLICYLYLKHDQVLLRKHCRQS
jgi:hypothetical protein